MSKKVNKSDLENVIAKLKSEVSKAIENDKMNIADAIECTANYVRYCSNEIALEIFCVISGTNEEQRLRDSIDGGSGYMTLRKISGEYASFILRETFKK